MNANTKDSKQRLIFVRNTWIIFFSGVSIMKGLWVVAGIAFVLKTALFFLTDLFSWQKSNFKWYVKYFFGVDVLSCLVAMLISMEIMDKSDVILWVLVPICLAIFLVEFRASEKDSEIFNKE